MLQNALRDTRHRFQPHPTLRQRLRHTTHDVHLRLHAHPAFHALAQGAIDAADYRALLARLYGFHVVLEPHLGACRQRSRSLEADLTFLGMTDRDIASIPRCAANFPVGTAAERLGTAYVVEGSALGGQVLSRSLSHLVGNGPAGKSFFAGPGNSESARKWQAFVARLEREGVAREAEVILAAVKIFHQLEAWMQDWKTDHG